MTIEVDEEALVAALKSAPMLDSSAMTAALAPPFDPQPLLIAMLGPMVAAYLEAVEAKKPELRVVKHDGAEFRWTAYDTRNDLIVAASTQGYNDPRDRDHNIEMVLGGGYRLDLQ